MAGLTYQRQDHDALAATVYIVDDDRDVRQSLALLVRSIGLEEESYRSALHFRKCFVPNKPGCLVLDVCMPGMSGLELQAAGTTGQLPPIIFITAHGEVQMASRAIRAGAVDFIQKPFDCQVILQRVREAIEIDRIDRCKRAHAAEVAPRLASLTQREREVMAFLVRGESTKQIAQKLSISSKTVDNHRNKILEKMKVDNPTQLVHAISAGPPEASTGADLGTCGISSIPSPHLTSATCEPGRCLPKSSKNLAS